MTTVNGVDRRMTTVNAALILNITIILNPVRKYRVEPVKVKTNLLSEPNEFPAKTKIPETAKVDT